MVKIHPKEQITTKEGPVPVMRTHLLKVLKNAPSFTEGETIKCYIAEYTNSRFCVWTASFIHIPNYHVFDSLNQLHEHFEEQL